VHLGGVEAAAEEHLAAEGAVDPPVGDDVIALDGPPGALGADREDLAPVWYAESCTADAHRFGVASCRLGVAVPVAGRARLGVLVQRQGLAAGEVNREPVGVAGVGGGCGAAAPRSASSS
jgi:hypothetical protein